jgi:hypothetical protein
VGSREWRLAAAVALLLAVSARAGDVARVSIVVLKEHGLGNQALAQPYLDKMVGIAAKQNGWPGVNGKYFTVRSAADAFIKSENPHYGILSLSSFLALRETYKLEVIGRVTVSLAGGRRYFLISRTAADLAGCKGQTLATDHADDPRFVDRVVLAGQAKLSDFKLSATQRPLQTIKAVLNGEAVCALVDDAQRDQLEHLENKDGARSVWQSAELPPMPVVAFPTAPKDEREKFKANLDAVCRGDGNAACGEVGVDDLARAEPSDYAAVVSAYGKQSD